jgi:long-chain fatty acid transport protein
MGEAWRFATGAQYALTPDMTLGAAYEFIWGGDMSVDQYKGPLTGRVSGDYNSANFSVLALNIIWKY